MVNGKFEYFFNQTDYQGNIRAMTDAWGRRSSITTTTPTGCFSVRAWVRTVNSRSSSGAKSISQPKGSIRMISGRGGWMVRIRYGLPSIKWRKNIPISRHTSIARIILPDILIRMDETGI